MLKDKLITLKYFDDEGAFSVFIVALPLFLISIVTAFIVIYKISKMMIAVKKMEKKRKEEKKQEKQ